MPTLQPQNKKIDKSVSQVPRFTHLHAHTHYSLLDGLGKIDDILDKVQELGMDSIAITDHGVMYGVPEFYEKATARGIKPIIGCEFYLAPNGLEKKRPRLDESRYHLILLAKNNTGYRNLMKLATIAHLEGYYYKPRIDMEVLEKHSEGLIGCTSCVQGEIPQLILNSGLETAGKKAREYQAIFEKNSFYLEMQHLPNFSEQEKVNQGLMEISQKAGIPLVATADIHYVSPGDASVQDILVCIQTNKKLDDTNRLSMTEHALHLKSPQEMWDNFQHIPEALENTQKIADRCNVTIKFGETILPYFKVPKEETDDSYLRKLCKKGLQERYPDSREITSTHQERLDYELGIISKMGFSSYFLIVQDFMNWAKEQKIVVGPGRGSAAGSFVSYLTGITNLDPIKYNLMFERFLNPDRISMPDVDADFADHRRDEVLQYCREKYGSDQVAQIITFGTMAARAAIRDAGRVLGVEYAYCDKLAKMVPMFHSLSEALEGTKELKDEYDNNTNAKRIIDAALRLEGIARHASVHACGVVITKEPVVNYSPLQLMSRKKGEQPAVVTQYAASSKSSYVEKIGLLKMDFLGLRNLTILENALKIIEKTTGEEIDIEKIPLDDEVTYQLLKRGETTGIFQLESAGMKRYLKQLKPTVFEDIIAMVALYRPGPMEWIPDFIAGKHGEKKVTYLHPKLEPILNNTYGVAVYQEQVMEIAKEIALFSGGEADNLRKVMGKKIIEKIAGEKKKFIEGAVKNGLTKDLAEKIFAFIEPFAGYGFNRSHAACYALIGYQTAYLKAHYPTQFMAALMNSDKNDTDRIAIEIEEAREINIEVLPPSVNESFKDFAVVNSQQDQTEESNKSQAEKLSQGEFLGSIRFGLEAIKGVGAHVAQELIREREKNGLFKDIVDLIERVQDKDLNKKSLEALAMSGALDSLIERNNLLKNIETILHYAKEFQKNATSGQSSLFSLGGEDTNQKLTTPKISLVETNPAPKNQRLRWEKALLGLYISDHPLRGYQDYFTAKSTPISKLNKHHINQNITVGGIIEKVQKINTRKGQTMLFATLEDGLGKLELLIFPKVLERNPEIWESENIILAKGKLSNKDEELKLLCEEGLLVDEEELKKYQSHPQGSAFKNSSKNGGAKSLDSKKLVIQLDPEITSEQLSKLHQILSESPSGDCLVTMVTPGENQTLYTPLKISPQKSTLEEARAIVGEDNLTLR